jgi:hypothetical protein
MASKDTVLRWRKFASKYGRLLVGRRYDPQRPQRGGHGFAIAFVRHDYGAIAESRIKLGESERYLISVVSSREYVARESLALELVSQRRSCFSEYVDQRYPFIRCLCAVVLLDGDAAMGKFREKSLGVKVSGLGTSPLTDSDLAIAFEGLDWAIARETTAISTLRRNFRLLSRTAGISIVLIMSQTVS